MRPIQPMRATQLKTQASCALGTWLPRIDFSGSMPEAMNPAQLAGAFFRSAGSCQTVIACRST